QLGPTNCTDTRALCLVHSGRWHVTKRYCLCKMFLLHLRVTLSSMAMEYYSISLMERGNVTM
ncbi:hypothetical protein GBAR_LOCUS19100, partial [Geodia barretti]